MEKETSCINARAILDYVNRYQPENYESLLRDLDPEIDALADPDAFMRDPNNWISCKVVSKLYERARSYFNDDMTAHHIAEYTVRNLSFGYGQRIIVKSLWSYKNLLRNVEKLNEKWNRSKRVELVELKKNGATIRLHWESKMMVTKDICLYNQGIYTFMPLIWGGKPLNLKETCCYFEGAPFCEYQLRWPVRNRASEIASRFFTSKSVLVETIKEMEKGKRLIEKKYEEVNRLNEALNRRITQLMALHDTGKAILSVLDLEELLSMILNYLSNACLVNRAMILLVNEKEKKLEYVRSVGFESHIMKEVSRYKVPLNRVSNILARVAQTGVSEYVPVVEKSALRKGNILLEKVRPSSIYVVPLITRSKVIGVIATDSPDKKGVPDETRETLDLFAPQIAIAIANARLYNRIEAKMRELRQSHALLSRAEKLSFFGNISARLAHEIKNPLTAVTTFLQMLPQKWDDEEFRNEFHETALEELRRVNNLITELLDLTKTKETRFGWEDLHSLIEKMIILISPQTKEKKIDILRRFDPEIGMAWIDSEKMKEVILNILVNAVEFSPRGGRVRISTEQVGNNDLREVHVQIEDDGHGIPLAMMDRIFDPYFTTKHKSSMHSGTGLGLFIALQNMQDQGGHIDACNGKKGGALFTIQLPLHEPDQSETSGEVHS
jgi:signal transduction histidine kinase